MQKILLSLISNIHSLPDMYNVVDVIHAIFLKYNMLTIDIVHRNAIDTLMHF